MSNRRVEFNGVEYSLEVEEKSAFWGNGVKIYIYSPDGSIFNTISYSCHPDFDGYEYYQNKSMLELTECAISRIVSDMDTEDFKLATENNIDLLLPVNKV